MLSFKNILCPTDFSAESKEAIRYAVKMADANHTTIHLLHTVEAPQIMDANSAMYYQKMLDSLNESAQEDMKTLLEELKAKYINYNFVTHVKDEIDSAESIVITANDAGAEAIVMASHGRKGLKRLLMGSVAESVMRLSEIPVIIIKMHSA